MSSFLLQDIPRHDTRVIEVREAFEHISLLGFHANISAYTAKKKPPAAPAGVFRGPFVQHALRRLLLSHYRRRTSIDNYCPVRMILTRTSAVYWYEVWKIGRM